MKDPNYVIKIEKAIADKYGVETILNPKSLWTEEKEKEYLEQAKEAQTKQQIIDEKEHKVEINGVFISKKLLSKESIRTCSVCNKYSFSLIDDVYLNKYSSCELCFVEFIEGREERWKNGWRPNNNGNNKS